MTNKLSTVGLTIFSALSIILLNTGAASAAVTTNWGSHRDVYLDNSGHVYTSDCGANCSWRIGLEVRGIDGTAATPQSMDANFRIQLIRPVTSILAICKVGYAVYSLNGAQVKIQNNRKCIESVGSNVGSSIEEDIDPNIALHPGSNAYYAALSYQVEYNSNPQFRTFRMVSGNTTKNFNTL